MRSSFINCVSFNPTKTVLFLHINVCSTKLKALQANFFFRSLCAPKSNKLYSTIEQMPFEKENQVITLKLVPGLTPSHVMAFSVLHCVSF